MASYPVNKCPLPKETIIDFLFEELSLEETAVVFDHLKACPQCDAAVNEYITALDSMRSAPQSAVSVLVYNSLKQRILPQAPQEQKPQSRKNRRTKLLAPLTLSAVVLLFSFIISDFLYISNGPGTYNQPLNNLILDSVLVALTSPFAPVCDTVLFLNNNSFFNQNTSISLSIPAIRKDFYSFSSDNLSPNNYFQYKNIPSAKAPEQHLLRERKIKAFNILPYFHSAKGTFLNANT